MSIPQAESSRRVVRSPLRRSKWASLRMALTCLPCVRSSTCVNCTTRTLSRCVHFARICAPHHSRVLTRLSCLLCRLLALCLSRSKLLDVFSSKTNLNLVLEFLDTDLEMIIKDRSLVFLPADIKSWMAMTFRGLEFCHRNFILHRVRTILSLHASRSPHGDGDQSYFFAYRPTTDHLYHVSISLFHFYYYYFF